ncbi:hypothetical protein BH23ACT7_BH23ACT7_18190 [soil metagenome]|jgi:hypothetical protein|nr:hypothetical protein [Euzebyaceae bacterium]
MDTNIEPMTSPVAGGTGGADQGVDAGELKRQALEQGQKLQQWAKTPMGGKVLSAAGGMLLARLLRRRRRPVVAVPVAAPRRLRRPSKAARKAAK